MTVPSARRALFRSAEFFALLIAAPARGQNTPAPVDVHVDAPARKPTEPVRDPTAAAFIVDADELERPGATAADALSYVPGVEVTRAGGGADVATASLRGATSAQTPIYLGGILLNDDLTGTVDLSTIPLWLLRSVEIDRGNAPADADRLGIGGAMFFDPALPAGTRARALVGVGSFGERQARAAASIGAERAAALFAVGHEAARDDYLFPDDRGLRFGQPALLTRRVNADHEATDAWAVARWQGPFGQVRALFSSLSREGGAPGLQVIPARVARYDLDRTIAGLADDLPCRSAASAARAADRGGPDRCAVEWAVDGLVTRYALRDPLHELGPSSNSDNAADRLRQRLRLRGQPTDWLEIAVGASQEQDQLDVATDASRLAARRYALRGDVEAQAAIGGRAQIVGILALDCDATAAHGPLAPASATGTQTCGVLAPSGRIGARARVAGPLDVFANFGRYVRIPTLGELYGVSSTVQGSPDLRPERAVAVDAGLAASGRAGPLDGYAQLDGFARWSDDLIAFERTSFAAVRPYNIGRARTMGAEAAIGARAWRWLSASLALSLLDPRDTSPGRQTINDLLPYHSRLVAAPQIELCAPAWRALGIDRARIAARYVYRSSRVADPAGLIVLPALSQLDLDAGARLFRRVTLLVRIANLLNQYSADVLGYPLPGRAGYANLEADW